MPAVKWGGPEPWVSPEVPIGIGHSTRYSPGSSRTALDAGTPGGAATPSSVSTLPSPDGSDSSCSNESVTPSLRLTITRTWNSLPVFVMSNS